MDRVYHRKILSPMKLFRYTATFEHKSRRKKVVAKNVSIISWSHPLIWRLHAGNYFKIVSLFFSSQIFLAHAIWVVSSSGDLWIFPSGCHFAVYSSIHSFILTCFDFDVYILCQWSEYIFCNFQVAHISLSFSFTPIFFLLANFPKTH